MQEESPKGSARGLMPSFRGSVVQLLHHHTYDPNKHELMLGIWTDLVSG